MAHARYRDREYVSPRIRERASRTKKKNGTLKKQTFFSLLLGIIIWVILASQAEFAKTIVTAIKGNLNYNIDYNKILEGINSIWSTLQN